MTITGRGWIIGTLVWPVVVFTGLVTALSIFLVVVPGAEVGLRVAAGMLAVVAGAGTWVLWVSLIAPKRLRARITRNEITLYEAERVVGVVRRESLGCVVRWGTLLFEFDRDDHIIGSWDLGWQAGMRSEQLFKRAMRRFDYPCRIFYHRPRSPRYRGPGPGVQFVEMARTGAIVRQMGAIPLKDKWAFTEEPIAPGPGISEGPMAQYIAALSVIFDSDPS